MTFRPKKLRLGLGIAVSCTAMLASLIVANHASAAAQVHATGVGGYSVPPAGSVPLERPLGAQITIPAGSTYYLTSDLEVAAASHVTEVTHLINCRIQDSSALFDKAVSGQNVLANTRELITTRGVFSAPVASNLVCSISAIFINHQSTTVSGSIQVGANTFIQDVIGSLPGSNIAWQGARVLDNVSYNTATATLTAPAGVTRMLADADVNVTTCYGSAPKAPCDQAGARLSGTGAYVGTQLVVQQLNSNGSVCLTTTSGPLHGTTVSNTVHHYKINVYMQYVPVSATCTSRTFKAYLRVTANAALNSIVIEANHQTETFLWYM